MVGLRGLAKVSAKARAPRFCRCFIAGGITVKRLRPAQNTAVASSIMATLALIAVLWLGYRYLTVPGAAKAAGPGD